MKQIPKLMAAMVLVAAATAMAQPASRPAGQGERPGMPLLERARNALNDLHLSDEQKTKVDEIFAKAKEKAESLRQEVQGLDPQERMQRVQEFAKGVKDQVAGVLNDDQRAMLDKKFDEARQNMRNRFGATTGPTSRPGGAGGMGPGMLDRLRDGLAKLELSDEQKAKVKQVFDDVRVKFADLREQLQKGSQEAREKVRDLMMDTRQKLGDILTPEQKEKLRSFMQTAGAPTSGPSSGPGRGQNFRERSGPRQRRGNESSDAGKPAEQSNAPPEKAAADAAAQVGQAAPAFSLKKLDGSLVQLSSLKGRVIVLEFGSYTSPAFRDRAAAMEKLRNEYGLHAQFFVIYAREAHAKGEWEVARNKDNDIAIDQPRTYEARLDLAKKAKQELKIGTTVLVDTIGNDTSISYAAGANSAFVINRDGMIIDRQEWFDPSGLKRAIDEAIKSTPTTKPVQPPAESR